MANITTPFSEYMEKLKELKFTFFDQASKLHQNCLRELAEQKYRETNPARLVELNEQIKEVS